MTSQNKFLEDLRYQKFVILLPPGNHGVSKEKLPFQKTVSPKSLWIQPWNRPWILNKSGLWIYKNSEYASGSQCARFIQGPKCAWITPEYAWLCLNILEYARICVNMSKLASMALVLHVPIVIPCPLKLVVTSTKIKLWQNMRPFSWRENMIFSIVAGSTWSFFFFFLTKFFHKLDFKFTVTFWGQGSQGP